jgi:hypothetical protein
MVDLDKYFEDPRQEEPHPKLRSWRKLIDDGNTARCELHRRLDGLTYDIPKLQVSFHDKMGVVFFVDEVEWEPELNEALLRLHVRAVSPENEGKRLGLMLKTWFARPDVRYGDFSCVLREYLGNSEIASRPPVRDALKQWREEQPNKESSVYGDCVESIEGVIVKAARSLIELGYERELAKDILASGIGQYLDERFSLIQRRMLGFH